jgi:hypothetical protein
MVADRAVGHLIDKKLNPAGITHTIGDNFYESYKRDLWYMPALALVANGIPALSIGGYQVPWFAWNALGVEPYNSYKPIAPAQHGTNHREKQPQLPPDLMKQLAGANA